MLSRIESNSGRSLPADDGFVQFADGWIVHDGRFVLFLAERNAHSTNEHRLLLQVGLQQVGRKKLPMSFNEVDYEGAEATFTIDGAYLRELWLREVAQGSPDMLARPNSGDQLTNFVLQRENFFFDVRQAHLASSVLGQRNV